MNAQTATAKSATDKAAAHSRELILLREDRSGIAILTLNRPQARNSLSQALLESLSDALTAIAHERSVRAVIIAANGPVFSAGHDLKELNAHRSDPDRGRAFFKHIMGLCSTVMQQIVMLPQPVIAAVHATATAAGCQLVASCDLAIASHAAKFATPGVNIGLFCSTPMVAVSRNVPRKHAMEMLLTGDMISAEDAQQIGLVNRVVAAGQEHAEAFKLAEKIAGKSMLTVKIGKEAFYRQAEMPLAEAYKYTSDVMVENMLARDAEEGISAFIEKRDPTWQDK
ncbi:MAG TPA: enoyl-CoA hydratase [Xanthobacteraceae bacterium]|jgi:enoyl-CoA hydratase/carnithine racemase|nr:enoyl-CoA hydratase [Xanthobacteraceae bacterium]